MTKITRYTTIVNFIPAKHQHFGSVIETLTLAFSSKHDYALSTVVLYGWRDCDLLVLSLSDTKPLLLYFVSNIISKPH